MERQRKRNIEQDNLQSMRILGERFIQRWDVHAIQLNDGRYVYMEVPLHNQHLEKHLKGEITLGAYALDKDDKAKYTMIDADDDVTFHQLFNLANQIEVPSYMEESRRGGHLWFFFEHPVEGKKAKTFGEELLAEYKLLPMEVFPKQEKLTGGPGSLVRLPFGVHKKSGRSYSFLNIEDGLPLAPTRHEQIMRLAKPNLVPDEFVDEITSLPLRGIVKPRERGSNMRNGNVWERIRKKETAMEFIGRYIELIPTPGGAIGICPFHEDEVESFAVNEKGNYWNCFAGCGGGSIIDFYMKLKDVELGEAVHDMRKILEV